MDLSKQTNLHYKSAKIAGLEVGPDDIALINEYTLSPLTEEEIFAFKVSMAANEIDRDFEVFPQATLAKLANLFVGKTVVKDHDHRSDNQIARIYATDLIEGDRSQTTKIGEPYTQLIARCYMIKTSTNADLIAEIKAGIRKEVSLGCRIGKAVCSICGTDNVQTYCAHFGGRKYERVLCYFSLEDPQDAYELSFVAIPAQQHAGTVKTYGDKQPCHRKDFDAKKATTNTNGQEEGQGGHDHAVNTHVSESTVEGGLADDSTLSDVHNESRETKELSANPLHTSADENEAPVSSESQALQGTDGSKKENELSAEAPKDNKMSENGAILSETDAKSPEDDANGAENDDYVPKNDSYLLHDHATISESNRDSSLQTESKGGETSAVTDISEAEAKTDDGLTGTSVLSNEQERNQENVDSMTQPNEGHITASSALDASDEQARSTSSEGDNAETTASEMVAAASESQSVHPEPTENALTVNPLQMTASLAMPQLSLTEANSMLASAIVDELMQREKKAEEARQAELARQAEQARLTELEQAEKQRLAKQQEEEQKQAALAKQAELDQQAAEEAKIQKAKEAQARLRSLELALSIHRASKDAKQTTSTIGGINE